MAEGLRSRTQVHSTPSSVPLSDSSLSDLSAPPVPRRARTRVPHWLASPLPPLPSCRPPPPPPSHTSSPAPDPNLLNTNNLMEAQKARLFEIKLTKSKY